MITIDKDHSVFLLSTNSTSYVAGIVEGALPVHLHWGRRLDSTNGLEPPPRSRRAFVVQTPVGMGRVDLNACSSEYGFTGSGDFRAPAWEAVDVEGFPILEAWYRSHTVHPSKPELEGLPSSRPVDTNEAETLELTLGDGLSGLEIHLYYTVFPSFDVITRSTVFVNAGSAPIRLLRAASLCIDLPSAAYDLISLQGAWGREAHVVRAPVTYGVQAFGSRRGTSSHCANPFVALAEPVATEHHGEIRGAALVYSGNFSAQVERTTDETARLLLGINPDGFTWKIAPGERFATPEAILVYSDEGLNGMSQRFHHFIRECVMQSSLRERPRPILVNNWEATHFQFTHDSLLPIVDAAAAIGVELFVLDDGWFGQRNDDRTSLGDWTVNREKLPSGLSGLGVEVARRGLKFGLWFEPEMVSPESELYRVHPDWCLHIPGRALPTGRNQLVLDLSRPEVCEEITRRLCAVLDSAPVSYVKWDMNRYLTHVASPALPSDRRSETAHRYVLGLYGIMEILMRRYPDTLFAGCSGGGGRFDAGILYYMPQIWASDNTDAVDRLRTQYGLSLVYPPSSIEAHVTAVPNHQVGRMTPFSMRGEVALSANFGFELDLSRLEEGERRCAAEMVAFYKSNRELIQRGTFWRLASPFEERGNLVSWMFTDKDRARAVLYAFRIMNEANTLPRRLRLRGLDAETFYRVKLVSAEGEQDPSEERSDIPGAALMGLGIEIPLSKKDFASFRWTINAVSRDGTR